MEPTFVLEKVTVKPLHGFDSTEHHTGLDDQLFVSSLQSEPNAYSSVEETYPDERR